MPRAGERPWRRDRGTGPPVRAAARSAACPACPSLNRCSRPCYSHDPVARLRPAPPAHPAPGRQGPGPSGWQARAARSCTALPPPEYTPDEPPPSHQPHAARGARPRL